MKPDARTAREHAETVQDSLRSCERAEISEHFVKWCGKCVPCLSRQALHALLAQVERLERERDEALAKIDALTRADYVFRAEAAEARAVQAERERDELLIERGEWDSWKNHAEACQRERDEARASEAKAWQAHADEEADCLAAEALAERRGEALRAIKPLVTGDLPPQTPFPMTMRCVEIADIIDAALARFAALQPENTDEAASEDPTAGLPADLVSALRDPNVVVPQDAALFDLLAKWKNAPSDTASAGKETA